MEEQKTKLVQALQETLNTEFPSVENHIESEEIPRKANITDPTPKNKTNFYNQGRSSSKEKVMHGGDTPDAPRVVMTSHQLQMGQGGASSGPFTGESTRLVTA